MAALRLTRQLPMRDVHFAAIEDVEPVDVAEYAASCIARQDSLVLEHLELCWRDVPSSRLYPRYVLHWDNQSVESSLAGQIARAR